MSSNINRFNNLFYRET